VRRREFILSLGAALWPVGALAQPATLPVVGFLSTMSPDESARLLAAFRRGLEEAGYIAGEDVMIEYRWVGEHDRLPFASAELARQPVAVLVSTAGTLAALAAKATVPTSPVIFSGADPVSLMCYNRPCGNTIGMVLTEALEPTRLNLLREMVPRAATIGVLLNPNFPPAAGQLRDMEEAARAIDVQLRVLRASSDREIDTALAFVAQHRIPALIVAIDPFFHARRDRIVASAARYAVPTMYQIREFATAGGLVSYGVDLFDLYRRVGVYVARILSGATPRDLPVMQPTKFELVINLKTAKALGLDIPSTLLARADEVIE
jgi:putative ABC transport system substrate-binding protein